MNEIVFQYLAKKFAMDLQSNIDQLSNLEQLCAEFNHYPLVDYLRHEVHDRKLIIRMISDPDFFKGPIFKLGLAFVGNLKNSPEVLLALQTFWDSHHDFEFLYPIMWRLLDYPELPREYHEKIYNFVVEFWDQWKSKVTTFCGGTEQQVREYSLERLRDPAFPKSKAWVYLCSAFFSEAPGLEQILNDYLNSTESLNAHVAQQLLQSYRKQIQMLHLGKLPSRITTEKNIWYGHFEIVEELGRGGMARVYKARHSGLQQVMALKILMAPECEEEDRQRFVYEAHVLSQIRHPHVVRVYEMGEIMEHQYIAMEYVQGTDLDNLVRTRHPLPLATVGHIMNMIVDAVQAIHHCNVIHRDIKPANILINQNMEVKVTDFGIAKNLSQNGMTATNVIIGTIGYISPEQWQYQAVDKRSDIYSMGITFFFTLTGQVPFTNIAEVMASQHCPDPRKLRLDIPDSLCDILFKMTQQNRDDRYSNLDCLLEDLQLAMPHTQQKNLAS